MLQGLAFWAKIIGVTFQRIITKMLRHLMGKNIDAYIDGMVFKSKKEPDHLKDLIEVFKILKKHKLRLNTAKCAFGVSSHKILGYLITRRGIEANSEQIMVRNDLVSQKNAKGLQFHFFNSFKKTQFFY